MSKRRLAHKEHIYTAEEARQQMAAFLAGKPLAEPGGPDLHPMMDPATYDQERQVAAEAAHEQLQDTLRKVGEALMGLATDLQQLKQRVDVQEAILRDLLGCPKN